MRVERNKHIPKQQYQIGFLRPELSTGRQEDLDTFRFLINTFIIITLAKRAYILIALFIMKKKMALTFLCGQKQYSQFSDKTNTWERLADARGKCEHF